MTEGAKDAPKKLIAADDDRDKPGSSDGSDEFDVIMLNPTKEYVMPFIYARIAARKKLYPYEKSQSGKWMMFFDKSILDARWRMCCELYKAGKLTGITKMKVSTDVRNPRATDLANGVIIFYCGPANDETAVTAYGKNLLDMISYSGNSYMYYKSDQQTFAGTRATGQTKNHLYKIPVPGLPESWR